MSPTPMDEPRRARRDAAGDEPADSSVLDTARRRLRAAVESVPFGGRVLGWFGPRGHDESQADGHPDGLADERVPPPSCPPIGDLPERTHPFSYPTRNRSESNPVDLVANESDEGLTVAHPDNPDARITSDVWEPVEQ